MVVGINTDQVKNFNEYLSCKTISSRVCRMQVSFKDITSEHVKNVAKEVVDKFQIAKTSFAKQVENHIAPPLVDQLNNAAQDGAQNQKAGVQNPSASSEIDFTVPFTPRKNEDTEEADCYTLESPGLCFYIGVLEYSPDIEYTFSKRHASSSEFEKMKDSFEELGCFLKKKTNPTKQKADMFLTEAIQWCEKLKPSFVVLIISTHGQEVPAAEKENPGNPSNIEGSGKEETTEEMVHQLFMHDGEKLVTKEIIKLFQDCNFLSTKPCLFLIQACRSSISDNVDPGVFLPFNVGNEKSTEEGQFTSNQVKDIADVIPVMLSRYPKEVAESKVNNAKIEAILGYKKQCQLENKPPIAPQENLKNIQFLENELNREGFVPKDTELILSSCKGYEGYILEYLNPKPVIFCPTPCFKDDLVMFASPPGKEAYNREKQGGWLITNLEAQIKETFNQKPKRVDLLAELTKVSGRIAQGYETSTDNPRDSGHKSVPCIYHKLSRDIIIWPEEMKKAKDLAMQDPQWQAFSKWAP